MPVRFTQDGLLTILKKDLMDNDVIPQKRTEKIRILPTEGLFNVRELGGYPVAGGYTKWGLIYRAGEPEGMNRADKKNLEGRGIKTVVDFRAAAERRSFLGYGLATVTKRVELPIDAGNLMGAVSGEWTYTPDTRGAAAKMEKLYAALPGEAIPRYRELFALLAEPANVPLIFHCSAGKDRTGLASALLLHALGASEETIMEDYLLSAECLRRLYLPYMETRPYMVPFMTVRRSYLLTALTVIKDEYGGLDGYLTRELRADIPHLRRLYTETPDP
ncbi:MAG: tyrosine-protein phosphatase [Spirochaetaceae bacterium]|jgi:protein-tyrosine phosphatase|nr:tyrosine-protein phosphatase [Spirochaetaceae bacterium]